MSTTRKTPKDQLESWHRDKAVQDNIVESWICVDCGTNTAPGIPSGPEMRVAFAMGAKKVEFTLDYSSEAYHVRDSVWKQSGMRPWEGCLCVGCLEKRIGRQLTPKDFDSNDRKIWADKPSTERLLNRRGFATVTVQTKDGPQEVICDIEDASFVAGKELVEE